MKHKPSVPFITGGIKDRDRMVVRYAALVALEGKTSDKEKEELLLIEDHLHRTPESILRRATELALDPVDRRHLSRLQRENLKRFSQGFRETVEMIEATRHRKNTPLQ